MVVLEFQRLIRRCRTKSARRETVRRDSAMDESEEAKRKNRMMPSFGGRAGFHGSAVEPTPKLIRQKMPLRFKAYFLAASSLILASINTRGLLTRLMTRGQ